MKIPGLIILTYVLSVFGDKTVLTEFDELEKLVENYDRRVRPNAGGPPVTVKLSVYVLNIPYINFGKHGMEITVDMYFRQFWEDTLYGIWITQSGPTVFILNLDKVSLKKLFPKMNI